MNYLIVAKNSNYTELARQLLNRNNVQFTEVEDNSPIYRFLRARLHSQLDLPMLTLPALLRITDNGITTLSGFYRIKAEYEGDYD